MADGNALAVRQTVVDLVREFERAEADIRAGFATIHAAQGRLAVAYDCTTQLRPSRRDPPLDFSDPDRAIVTLRRYAWASLIERLELRKIMSIKRWEALSKQVHDGPDTEVPPITVELVLGMAENFRSQMSDMARESIRETYDWLRPRVENYKTNSPFGVGKRVVLTYMVERYSSGGGWHVSYHYSQHLTALERVFRMLDGRGATSSPHHYSELETAIRAVPPGDDCRGETTYFRFKGFKNRNLHLEFLRPDLLATFNQVAGGGMLPQKTGEKRRAASAEVVLADAVTRFREERRGEGLSSNLFETPWDLARDAVERLELAPGLHVLEPSAGRGALVRAINPSARSTPSSTTRLTSPRSSPRSLASEFATFWAWNPASRASAPTIAC